MAEMIRRPSPGMLKTISVTTAPPISTAVVIPMTVTTGTIALRKACPTMTTPCDSPFARRSEEHTSELQSRLHLVCRLLLEKKKKIARAHDETDVQIDRVRNKSADVITDACVVV